MNELFEENVMFPTGFVPLGLFGRLWEMCYGEIQENLAIC